MPGLIELPALLNDLTAVISQVMLSLALTQFRSAEEMSRMALFVDAASWIDRTNWPNTFISYYVYGAALGVGLISRSAKRRGRHKVARRRDARAVEETRESRRA